jgi:protein-tyrosine phosphatase
MKILFVCLGNICRSPLAQGIFELEATVRGLDITFDSAGLIGLHAGDKPDRRSIAKAAEYGIDISQQRARLLELADYDDFDHIWVMDRKNYENAINRAPDDESKHKVSLLLDQTELPKGSEVPDPYYDNRFQHVYDLLQDAAVQILSKDLRIIEL